MNNKKQLLYSTDSTKYNNKPLIQTVFMRKLPPLFLTALLTISLSTSVFADSDAEQAAKAGLKAVTIFIDISRFSRKNGAAKKMTQSHQEFARHGYTLVAVNVYTENGDLEGFFVSYRQGDVMPNP